VATSTRTRRSAVEVEIVAVPHLLQAAREVVAVSTCLA
jgi:hypothetical protein